MKKKSSSLSSFSNPWILFLGGFVFLFLAYGRLILHPDLHTACPENDTWNLPIRWSVLSALRHGNIPLWNPLSAFGIPWLATWQTESFYPGTLLFTWFGLSAWNYSGLLHLVILSLGVFFFLRSLGVKPFWAFFSASIALLNGCAYNHLGSNSSMDTMAWIPWMLLATHRCMERKPWAALQWILFFVLQVFAGYPQIIFYTFVGCLAYAVFLEGWKAPLIIIPSFLAGLLFSVAQWMPSVEYFFINSVRLPAVHDNPHFFMPLENIKTFFDFNALSQNGLPDYVANPTFFYFNFYSGFLPLLALILSIIRFRKLKSTSRFFLVGFFFLILWSLGVLLHIADFYHLPYPAFLEPAKCWVLINVFELLAIGLVLEDLFPRPGTWKWAVLALAVANLLWPIWNHPLERNLLPNDLESNTEAKTFLSRVGDGRLLILPNADEHRNLYTPLPDPQKRPIFKHFVPNSNLLADLPSATFYGSTQPTWGTLDAGFYFQYVFPKDKGTLMDLLGVDLIYLPENHLPSRYQKVLADGKWVLWKNPSSLGSHFFFYGKPQTTDRKSIFSAFAHGDASPLRNLFLDPAFISLPPLCKKAPLSAAKIPLLKNGKNGFLIVTENAVPGWRAWVDGHPTSIGLADGIFQCLSFGAGDSRVELSYEPASFRLGLFLSLLSLGGLFGWLGIRKSDGLNF